MNKRRTWMAMGLALLPGLARAATLTLDWNANAEADLAGYRIYQATASLLGMTTAQAFAGAAVTKTVVTAPTVTRAFTGLLDGASYFFRLTASDNSGNESTFNLDAAGAEVEVSTFTPLPAPTGLAATAASSSSIRLTWTDASNSATGFLVERSPNGTGGWSAVGTTAASPFTDAGLSGGTSYFYRVRTVRGATQSAPSGTAGATTPAAPDVLPPAAPRGLSLR